MCAPLHAVPVETRGGSQSHQNGRAALWVLPTWVQFPEPSWWKERAYSCELSANLHMYSVVCFAVSNHTHSYTNKHTCNQLSMYINTKSLKLSCKCEKPHRVPKLVSIKSCKMWARRDGSALKGVDCSSGGLDLLPART